MICPNCGCQNAALIIVKKSGYYLCAVCNELFNDIVKDKKVDSSKNDIKKTKQVNLETLLPIEVSFLAIDYKYGFRGLEKNADEAFRLFENAATRGEKRAQYFLSKCYENGEGVNPNVEEALFWMKKSAQAGYQRALLDLEQRHIKIYNEIIQKNDSLKICNQKELRKKLLPFCMIIKCYKRDSGIVHTGSGFILKNGLVLTNSHVISCPESVKKCSEQEIGYSRKMINCSEQEIKNVIAYFDIDVDSQSKEYPLKLLRRNCPEDIAVFEFNGGLPPHLKNGDGLELGDSDKVEALDEVFSIGNPFGLGLIMTEGKIAQRSQKNSFFNRYNELLQLNMSINSGNSGGPLFNSQGQVVGITTFTPGVRNGDNNREAVNMGFAVTSKTIKNIIQQYQGIK